MDNTKAKVAMRDFEVKCVKVSFNRLKGNVTSIHVVIAYDSLLRSNGTSMHVRSVKVRNQNQEYLTAEK